MPTVASEPLKRVAPSAYILPFKTYLTFLYDLESTDLKSTPKLLLFLLLWCHFSSQARPTGKSFVCPENSVEYKGVTCCLDAVKASTCRQLIDRLISTPVLESITTVKAGVQTDQYAFGRVPNCFWNALNYNADFNGEDPRYVDPSEFSDRLADLKYAEADGPPTLGDVVIFMGHGETREDILENFVPKRIWVPYQSLEHAAIYLEDGLIFQKENIGTDVFSIDTLDHSQRAYEKAFNSKPHIRGQLDIQTLRKASSSGDPSGYEPDEL